MRHAAWIVVLAGLAAGCAKQEAPPEPVRPVQLVQATRDANGASAVFAGEVKPRFEADLGFRIAGKIVERKVDVGSRVRRGALLARLDPADVALQAQAARAALAAAETDARFASAELARYEDLHAQRFVSASALDAKRSASDAARSRAQQARAQLAVYENQAGYASLVAPYDAVITAVTAEAGQVVTAGQPVMKLAREVEREVAISVPENRIAEIRNADALTVGLWANPAKAYRGELREVSPAVDPVTRTFAVRVRIVDADSSLQWGMTANVAVSDAKRREGVVLPMTAVYHRPDGTPAVWVYDPQSRQVALRAVTLGPFLEDGVRIESGVASGEWVVAAGVNKLQPGQTVRPYEGSTRAVPGETRTAAMRRGY